MSNNLTRLIDLFLDLTSIFSLNFFLDQNFDKMIAILSLSEMYNNKQDFCYKSIHNGLKHE